jgi:hypothetical protein
MIDPGAEMRLWDTARRRLTATGAFGLGRYIVNRNRDRRPIGVSRSRSRRRLGHGGSELKMRCCVRRRKGRENLCFT